MQTKLKQKQLTYKTTFEEDDFIENSEDCVQKTVNFPLLPKKPFKLNNEQKAVIKKLKSAIAKDGQLFALIQGSAGSGKSTISKKFAEELG